MLAIEIVRSGDTIEAFGHKKLRTDLVGNVERKISNNRHVSLAKKSKSTEVTSQNSVRFLLVEQVKDAQFIRLLDSRCGEVDRRRKTMSHYNGVTVLADVLKLGVQISLAKREYGLQLVERAHKDMQRLGIEWNRFGCSGPKRCSFALNNFASGPGYRSLFQ